MDVETLYLYINNYLKKREHLRFASIFFLFTNSCVACVDRCRVITSQNNNSVTMFLFFNISLNVHNSIFIF